MCDAIYAPDVEALLKGQSIGRLLYRDFAVGQFASGFKNEPANIGPSLLPITGQETIAARSAAQ